MAAHSHAESVGDLRRRQRLALWVALGLNAVFMVVEIAGGLIFGSLALIADGAHMLTDVVGLGVALVGARLMERDPTRRHTYGLQRAEVLAAQANGILILLTSGFILYEAVRRIGSEPEIFGPGLLVIAVIGLFVNLGSAAWLARVKGQSLNVRGAYVHLLTDAAGSIGAIIAGVAVIVWDATWVDTVASIVIGLGVLWASWRLLRDTTQVLLEGTPQGVDIDDVRDVLASEEHVEDVHHLHVWNLASDSIALSAHIVLRGRPTVGESQHCVRTINRDLNERFGIDHATLEIEADLCADDDPC